MLDFAFKKVYNTVIKFNMINKNDRILVGFSGGADSLFLMLSLIELKKHMDFEIFAAHLNHGIRGSEADDDEKFVSDFCEKNKIILYNKKVNIPEISEKNKISEEVAGRNERYSFFNEICTENGITKIAVAHNKNDSVETVILNLIRGASLTGLCGIKPKNNNIIRPIIEISRAEIELYLNKNNISYLTDSTNLTDIYTRNKIRNTILKSMSEINSSVIETIYSNLVNLNNDEDFIRSYCERLDCITKTDDEIIINKDIFDKEHVAIKCRILLMAFAMLKGNTLNISSTHLSIILNADKTGKTYDMPDDIKVKISYNSIILSVNKDKSSDYSYILNVDESIEYMRNNFILCSYCDNIDLNEKNVIFLDADIIKSKNLVVRNRRNGDKFVPFGMSSEKKLKNFFIDIKLPVDKRNETPIITDGEEIVAVVPYRVCEYYKVTNKTKKILKIKIYQEV